MGSPRNQLEGYLLTLQGLKPWRKEIDTVLKMEPPNSTKQLRGFIVVVNYYQDICPHRTHILAPLTAKTGTKSKVEKKDKFTWNSKMNKICTKMKALMAADKILAYLNHNKHFHIYTDASNYQLEAYIIQDKCPVVYYARQLNKAQLNYNTMEQEILSIVGRLFQ